MLGTTTGRVSEHTAEHVNREISERTERTVAYFARNPDEIERRLDEIDREWDVERTLEANAATLAFAGVVLGATVDRRWLLLPAAVTAFLLQHAVQGWCPPMVVLRRLGVRTASEIGAERFALKTLRGDLDGIDETGADPRARARRVLEAVHR